MIFWSDDPDSTVRVGFANISTRGERWNPGGFPAGV